MEDLQSVPALEATPAPVTAPITAPVAEVSAPIGQGAIETVVNSKMDLKTIFLTALLAAMAVYSIFASKKILEEQEQERVNAEEFDALGEEIDQAKLEIKELTTNLKKVMGARYETLKK